MAGVRPIPAGVAAGIALIAERQLRVAMFQRVELVLDAPHALNDARSEIFRNDHRQPHCASRSPQSAIAKLKFISLNEKNPKPIDSRARLCFYLRAAIKIVA